MMFDISDLNKEKYLSLILNTICEKICVTSTDYKTLEDHFNGLTEVLENGIDERFSPILRTQGSIRLGTAIKPLRGNGLDADIICELYNVPSWYTQEDVQEIVGKVLRGHEKYCKLLKEPKGGRRCFTIEYADGTHVDILPCVVDDNYRQRMLTASIHYEDYILKITDKKDPGFSSDTNRDNWHKSNPIGFSNLFQTIAQQFEQQNKSLMEMRASVEPFPEYETKEEKLTLQRVVQLLKRHRDVMMGNDDDKPVSILITTLAEMAFAKSGGGDLYRVLSFIVHHLKDYIQHKDGKPVVLNPVLPAENFADKWTEKPRKKQCFEDWYKGLSTDIQSLQTLEGVDLANKLKEIFGENPVNLAYRDMAQKSRADINSGKMTMSTQTGSWEHNSNGKISKPHTFYATNHSRVSSHQNNVGGDGYKLMPSKPHLALPVQKRLLESTYPNSWIRDKSNGFDWYMEMKPKADSLTYTVKIEVRQNFVPQVQVVSPMPLAYAPGKTSYEHINHPQHLQYLCLNVKGEWTPDMRIADTFVPWAAEWLLQYEYWLVTGKWDGGGHHRDFYKP